jgi:hypothetical protein
MDIVRNLGDRHLVHSVHLLDTQIPRKSICYLLSIVLQSELSGYNNNHISDLITVHGPLYHHSALEPTYCIVACTLVQVAYAHLISSHQTQEAHSQPTWISPTEFPTE